MGGKNEDILRNMYLFHCKFKDSIYSLCLSSYIIEEVNVLIEPVKMKKRKLLSSEMTRNFTAKLIFVEISFQTQYTGVSFRGLL